MSTHEDLSREQAVEGGSDRAFGVVFCFVFLIIGLYPLLAGGVVRVWAMLVAGTFMTAALLKPQLLSSMNRLWTRFGVMLGNIISPIALGIVFYGVITPTGFLLRARGKDLLKLRRDEHAQSYWQQREPPGPDPASLPQQF